jgi:MFS family permease
LTTGAVLSAFFGGYTLMQIPGGLLADRFGPRAVLAGSIAWWSVMTAMTGAVAGLATLLAVRVLFGFGEGPFPAAASKALTIWFPRRQLGRVNGLQLAAIALGAMIAPLFVVTLISHFGWRWVFFALFVPGAVLAGSCCFYIRGEGPGGPHGLVESRPRSARGGLAASNGLSESLRTPAVLWAAGCTFLANVLGWGLLNWLPTYLMQARGFGPQKMGWFASLTSLALGLGYIIGGYVCDRYFSDRLRVPIAGCLLMNAGLTYLAARAVNGEWAAVYLALGFFAIGVAGTALSTLPLIVVPQHAAATAYGLVNTAGQLAGLVSPLLVGYVLELTHGNFEVVLCCLVAVAVASVYPATRIRQSMTLNAVAQ